MSERFSLWLHFLFPPLSFYWKCGFPPIIFSSHLLEEANYWKYASVINSSLQSTELKNFQIIQSLNIFRINYNFYIEVEEINVSALWLLTQSIYLYYFWFQVCKGDNRFHLFDKEKSENGINSNNVWKVTMKVRKATYRN